jgi:hypothetical protein
MWLMVYRLNLRRLRVLPPHLTAASPAVQVTGSFAGSHHGRRPNFDLIREFLGLEIVAVKPGHAAARRHPENALRREYEDIVAAVPVGHELLFVTLEHAFDRVRYKVVAISIHLANPLLLDRAD